MNILQKEGSVVVVNDVQDCCGGFSVVSLMDGRAFTAKTKVVKKAGVVQEVELEGRHTEKGLVVGFSGYWLAILPN
jgi:hypothetical protein